MFMDNESSINIIYYETFKKIGLIDKEMYHGTTRVHGFIGDSVKVKDTMKLLVTLGKDPLSITQVVVYTH